MSDSAENVVAGLGLRDDPAPVESQGQGEGQGQAPSSGGRDYEAEAASKGWRPKDEFSADPSKWVDAKTFVERGERFASNLQKEVETLKRQVASFEGTKKQFREYFEEVVAKKNAEIDANVRELRLQRTAAMRDGEDEAVLALEDRIESLRAQKQELKEAPAQGLDPAATDPTTNPILNEWVEDGNDWFNADPTLRAYALQIGDAMVNSGTKLRGRPFLDSVSDQMRAHFPRKFAKLTESSAPTDSRVNSGGRQTAAGNAGGRTKADLPAADRQLMEQGVREGWFKDEKSFLDSYFSRP